MQWRLPKLALDIVLPPRCVGCGAIVDATGRFCRECWNKLEFIGDGGCEGCNKPLPGGEPLCAGCLVERPRHGRVLAAVAYGELARRAVLRLKYGRRPGVARALAPLIVRGRELRPDALLVPVPLHRWRLWGRGYNQAAELGRVIAAQSGLQLAVDLLVRRKRTPTLKGLGHDARRRVLQGAFAAARKAAGRPVYLVDDVYTSGATADACARALKRAGAEPLGVLCWARVLRDD